MPTGYKPSPLGYGSPRSSPFRRPESPASPSTLRQTTPRASPAKPELATGGGKFTTGPANTSTSESWAPRGSFSSDAAHTPQPRPLPKSPGPKTMANGGGNALSQLQPAQVRTLRDGFQILDRDSDGIVNREDVADMLTQLGKDTTHMSDCRRNYLLIITSQASQPTIPMSRPSSRQPHRRP